MAADNDYVGVVAAAFAALRTTRADAAGARQRIPDVMHNFAIMEREWFTNELTQMLATDLYFLLDHFWEALTSVPTGEMTANIRGILR